MAAVIDGKKISAKLLEELRTEERIRLSFGRQQLVMFSIMIGHNGPARSFLASLEKAASKIPLTIVSSFLSEEVGLQRILKCIKEPSSNITVGGVLLHLPLPKQCDKYREIILDAIGPLKDVGCLNPATKKILPPAVETMEKILSERRFLLKGKKIVVLGAGYLIGSPIIQYLNGKCEKTSVFKSKTSNGKEYESALREADLVICGAGKPGILNPIMVRPGAGVIDFGFGFRDGKPMGDLDTAADYLQDLSFYTPTPGGTGPILTAVVLENFFKLTRSYKKV